MMRLPGVSNSDNIMCMQLGGAAVASGVLKGLDPTGFKAAAGAANQLNPSTVRPLMAQ